MSTCELITVDPSDLKFTFELNKQITSSLHLTNNTDQHVAFKVFATNLKNYSVRLPTGVVSPQFTYEIIVTMQAQKEAPHDMQCKDKFLIKSVIASPGATPKDITSELFTKETLNVVEECKLRVFLRPR
ncbi:vesicle-associated protein 1-2-like [Bidens hawaiensis]|uniref:vesicle-associated protein 1-2-like n=1 Tax=Bidens hawaiensis TaxID=980011 RepID=UPI00404A747A